MRLSAFARLGRLDDRGNVAMIAALAIAPISLASLGAMDVARATSAKSQLQDALDAAALAAARTNSTDTAALTAAGERYLKQNLALAGDMRLKSSTFAFGDGGKVVATAKVEIDPFVAGLITGGKMGASAESEVVRANMKVEIALVLDTTGSMEEGTKLADMKKAAKDFVTTMENASKKSIEADVVKISLVPFANTVRLDGTTYRSATWMDQSGASPINNEIFTTASGTQFANRFTLFTTLGTSWRGCVEMRKAPYDVQDDAPTTGTPATLYTPYFAPDEPDARTTGYGDSYQNSYLSDGTSSSNWRVRQGSITKYKSTSGLGTSLGPNRGCGVSKMMRLTTDFSGLRTAIQNLEAEGNTNIPIGMSWGWNTLAPKPPFSDGAAYGDTKSKKIVVLMTDGENTLSQRDTPNDGTYAANGYMWQGRVLRANGTPLPVGATEADRTAALDSRLKLLCTNMKSKGIEIYTIRVEAGSSSLLEACASTSEHFYNVTKSTNLTSAFQSIAGQIAALHLSR